MRPYDIPKWLRQLLWQTRRIPRRKVGQWIVDQSSLSRVLNHHGIVRSWGSSANWKQFVIETRSEPQSDVLSAVESFCKMLGLTYRVDRFRFRDQSSFQVLISNGKA